MVEKIERKVNVLPVPTWNWLRMNSGSVYVPAEVERHPFELELPQGVEHSMAVQGHLGELATGMGPELDRMAECSEIETDILRIPAGYKAEEPIRMSLHYGDGAAALNRLEVHAGAGSQATLILDFSSRDVKEGLAALQLRILAERGAQVQVVQIQRLEDTMVHLADLGGRCLEDARLQITQLELGAGSVYAGCEVALDGDASGMKSDVGYLGRGEQRLDFNYTARHRGRKTESGIQTSGILRDRAQKCFRGTIDFLTGSAGSVGEEQEDALLLGDEVVNQTIPLILCGEEDVQGNHGATLGRLDEELLFYLASRGLTEEQVYTLVSRSRIQALCHQISDERTLSRVQEYLDQVVGMV